MPSKIEIVIVDDGSKDKTWEIILDWTRKYPDCDSGVVVRGLKQKENQGKKQNGHNPKTNL